MEDFENEQTDFDLTDPDDQRVYDQRYLQKIKELSGSLDNDAKEDIVEEMGTLKYNPSNSPENDAHLNWLRSQNIAKQKSRFDSHSESLLRFQAEESGKSLSHVKREAMQTLKKGGNR